MSDRSNYLSLNVDITDKKIVVFGGGKVAERKVGHFLGSKHLVVVSRSLTEGLQILWEGDQLDHINARLLIKDDVLISALMDSAFLVVPATSDQDLNKVIKSLADEKGILCNDVDQSDEVLVPFQVHSQEASVAITTYGKSPAMIKYLKENTDEILTPQVDAMIRLQGWLRNKLKKKVDKQEKRRDILTAVIQNDDIWELLPDEEKKARALTREFVKDYLD